MRDSFLAVSGKDRGDPFIANVWLVTPFGFMSSACVLGDFQRRWWGLRFQCRRRLIPAPARFNQLLAGIPGISDRVLTERLRELETEGLVERLVDPGPPVRVSYRLTSRGRALEPVLAAVADWAESWLTPAVAAAG